MKSDSSKYLTVKTERKLMLGKWKDVREEDEWKSNIFEKSIKTVFEYTNSRA